MAITIEQVSCWAIFSGISHIVMGSFGGGPGYWVACGIMYAPTQNKPTKRICKKCRKAMKDIVPAKK